MVLSLFRVSPFLKVLKSMSSSHLSPAQITELQQALETRQAEIQARLTEMQGGKSRVEHAREVLQQDGDDAPQRDSDREVSLATSDMGAVDLARVNGALARIANGTYGLCDACDCPIPYARLQVEPQTQHCVACKSEWEKNQGIVPTAKM